MTQSRQESSGFTARQKGIAGAFVVIIAVIIWQIMGLFSGGSTPAPAAHAPSAAGMPNMSSGGAPAPAAISKPAALSEREQELMKLQQETEAKYLAALNELQMLKVEKEIAETSKAIAAAKLDTVTAQKGVVDLLTAPSASQLPFGNPPMVQSGPNTAAPTTTTAPTPPPSAEVTYAVISVTQLHAKWNAVLSYHGTLYQVGVGDILPPDSSKVVSIDKSGVVLEKEGARKKVSLVSII